MLTGLSTLPQAESLTLPRHQTLVVRTFEKDLDLHKDSDDYKKLVVDMRRSSKAEKCVLMKNGVIRDTIE